MFASRNVMKHSADIENNIPPNYLPTSETATASTFSATERRGSESENAHTPESLFFVISMAHGHGSSSPDTITPRPLSDNMTPQNTYYNYTAPSPLNHDLDPTNTSSINFSSNSCGIPQQTYTSTGLGHFNTTQYGNTHNNPYPVTNTYPMSSINPHLNDPTYFPGSDVVVPDYGGSGTSQNSYPDRPLPHAVTDSTYGVPPRLNTPTPTLYAQSDLQLRPRSNGRPGSQTRYKPYTCNIAGCRDNRFLTTQSRSTHGWRNHKQLYICTHQGCPRMEDYTDFKSRQALDEHWWSEHQAAKPFRCFKCCYSTENVTHMRKMHLKRHYKEEKIRQAMEGIRRERNGRNASSG